jgi:hypothetical protein
LDDGSRAAIAVLEAFRAIYNRLVDLGIDLSKRTEVDRREPSCSPGLLRDSLIVFNLIVDLKNLHSINWSIEVWWDDTGWTIVGVQYWTKLFPYDGWNTTWESERRVSDLRTLVSELDRIADKLAERARLTNLSSPESWSRAAE